MPILLDIVGYIHNVCTYIYRIEREAFVHCKMFVFLSGTAASTQVDCKNSNESIVVVFSLNFEMENGLL